MNAEQKIKKICDYINELLNKHPMDRMFDDVYDKAFKDGEISCAKDIYRIIYYS